MKQLIRHLIAPLALIAVFWFALLADRFGSGEYQFRHAFELVEPGMHRNQILNFLGPPNEMSTELQLGQRKELEPAVAGAARGDSVEYLIWFFDADSRYTIGLDAEGYVSISKHTGS